MLRFGFAARRVNNRPRPSLAYHEPQQEANGPGGEGRQQHRRLRDARKALVVRILGDPQACEQVERQIMGPAHHQPALADEQIL